MDTIIETLSEVSKLRRKVEAIKIAEHVSEDEIDKWNGAIENVMESDAAIETLQDWLKTDRNSS